MTHNAADIDAFGWSTLSRSSLPHGESHGFDYESAREATPRWFAVSSGNGNDGVSHTFPDYYVRTYDPWTLARAAMLSQFKPAGYAWAHEAAEIEGEADYVISATIYDPPEDETESDNPRFTNYYEHCGETWSDESACTNNDRCPVCDKEIEPYESEDIESEESESWSSVNGAWLIVEVFPADCDPLEIHALPLAYESLADCFTEDVLQLARED